MAVLGRWLVDAAHEGDEHAMVLRPDSWRDITEALQRHYPSGLARTDAWAQLLGFLEETRPLLRPGEAMDIALAIQWPTFRESPEKLRPAHMALPIWHELVRLLDMCWLEVEGIEETRRQTHQLRLQAFWNSISPEQLGRMGNAYARLGKVGLWEDQARVNTQSQKSMKAWVAMDLLTRERVLTEIYARLVQGEEQWRAREAQSRRRAQREKDARDERFRKEILMATATQMRAITDACRVLGLAWPTSQTNVRSAYRNLAKQTHPDVGGDPQHFKTAQAAYELLQRVAAPRRIVSR